MNTQQHPQIECEPDGFSARFTVEPTDDFPQRCFEVLARHRVEPRSLSIFRESNGCNRLTVTLSSGLCAQSEFRKVLDELTQQDTNAGEESKLQSGPSRSYRRSPPALCCVS